jgi:predicted dehydrogenase
MDRREFLRSSIFGAASIAVVASATRPLGAQAAGEEIAAALVGCGNWGRNMARLITANRQFRLVGFSDPDERRLNELAGMYEARVKATDYRKLLDDKSIDAIFIATPTHWNAVAATNSMFAGKDVYLETPVTHNVREWDVLYKTERETRRILQAGFQWRSDPSIDVLREDLASIGKIRLLHFTVLRPDIVVPRQPNSEPPSHLHYDLWVGPSPIEPYNVAKLHTNWRWFWQHGTGVLGDDGARLFDLATWLLGIPGAAGMEVSSHAKKSDESPEETPSAQSTVYKVGEIRLIWEHRAWLKDPAKRSVSVRFVGDGGTIDMDQAGWTRQARNPEIEFQVEDADESKELPRKQFKSPIDPTPHINDFAQAMKERKPGRGDFQTTRVGNNSIHLGNIATRLRVDDGKTITLQFDGERSLLVNSAEASRLLTREYRKGYELPAN